MQCFFRCLLSGIKALLIKYGTQTLRDSKQFFGRGGLVKVEQRIDSHAKCTG